jgi:KipI family sensor histidine kinase inhibitor
VSATVIPFGDTAAVVEVDDARSARLLARQVDGARRSGNAPEGIEEAVVGLRSVVVRFDPRIGAGVVDRWLTELVDTTSGSDPSDGGEAPSERPAPHLEIPVVFDGPDLGPVAERVEADVDAVVSWLTAADLSVAFLGFSPGFAYLDGLPQPLADVPRLPSPRSRVPAGSVAIGGGFASVYPSATPGGWQLLGRTAVTLFDPLHPPYARLAPGDTVRFTVADRDHQSGSLPPSPERSLLSARGGSFVEVLGPGLLSLVQDAGRRNTAGIGVPRAGPADPDSMRLANRLVGNPDDAAVIEVTGRGPLLRVTGDIHLGVVATAPEGVEVEVDGHPVAPDAALPVGSGQTIAVGRVLAGLRAYVAVSGGFETPTVIESRSSDVLAGLGPGPLRAGDRLGIGPPTRPRGQVLPAARPSGGADTPLRVLPGPHRITTTDLDVLGECSWTVTPESNRIGVRLERPSSPGVRHSVTVPSLGMVPGAVQIPPEGDPIVLGPDHATVGGYPVVGCVIAADLPALGQLAPGSTVTFLTVDQQEAHQALLHRERALAGRVRGWFPTVTPT